MIHTAVIKYYIRLFATTVRNQGWGVAWPLVIKKCKRLFFRKAQNNNSNFSYKPINRLLSSTHIPALLHEKPISNVVFITTKRALNTQSILDNPKSKRLYLDREKTEVDRMTWLKLSLNMLRPDIVYYFRDTLRPDELAHLARFVQDSFIYIKGNLPDILKNQDEQCICFLVLQ